LHNPATDCLRRKREEKGERPVQPCGGKKKREREEKRSSLGRFACARREKGRLPRSGSLMGGKGKGKKDEIIGARGPTAPGRGGGEKKGEHFGSSPQGGKEKKRGRGKEGRLEGGFILEPARPNGGKNEVQKKKKKKEREKHRPDHRRLSMVGGRAGRGGSVETC